MLHDMSCRVFDGAKSISGNAVHGSLSSSWVQRESKSCKSLFMRKQLELARHSYKLFRLQASYQRQDAARSASSMRAGYHSHAGRPSDLQPRFSSSGSSPIGDMWKDKKMQHRQMEEFRRSQRMRQGYHASPERAAGHALSRASGSRAAPNDPIEAQSRANPVDAAQPRHASSAAAPEPVHSLGRGSLGQSPLRPGGSTPPHDSVQAKQVPSAASSDSAHSLGRTTALADHPAPSLQRSATESTTVAYSAVTQSPATDEEAHDLGHQEFDLHSPTVNYLAARKLSGEELTPGQQQEEATEAPAAEVSEVPADVCVVTTSEEARRVVQLIRSQYQHMCFACDTEVMDIDLSKESPCGHGTVTCFSLYGGVGNGSGPAEVCNFAADPDATPQDQLWVDTMLDGNQEAVNEMFAIFKEFFEDDSIKKVWHNYSFDRHVLRNHGIDCAGFAADTMHMARLWDSSRQGKGSYSLEGLTNHKELMKDYAKDMRAKTGMKILFGRKNIKKDNTEGKLTILPAVEELQVDPVTRGKWIDYSAYDAKATWQLAQSLRKALQARQCMMDPAVQQATGNRQIRMFEMYEKYWRPFGLLLTDMEKEGMSVNRAHLAEGEQKAYLDQEQAMHRFRNWAAHKVPGAQYMNVGSGAQIRQLLFAGVENQKPEKGTLEDERVFKAPNVDGWIDPESKTQKPKKNIDFYLHGLWGKGAPPSLQPEVYTAAGWPAVSTPVLRALAGKPGAAKHALEELYGVTDFKSPSDEEVPLEAMAADDELVASVDVPATESRDDDMEAVASEPAQQASAVALDDANQSTAELEEEAGKKGYGRAYAAFGGGKAGLEACAAMDAVCEHNAIDTLLSNFIKPLQGSEIATYDSKGQLDRVHCSLNINTETGRLSARRPNLQNQPALEKDRYKVRKAFTANVSKGNTLVVADYGQLELRILAHLADCESMIRAFELGGDFHSRTALGMYDHIKQAINKGACILERDGSSVAEIPLLKDMFASERRKAKVLNFSIAYGKTAHGLSRDWKVSLEEATDTVNKWYSDRPEVQEWQIKQQNQAEKQGYVSTLLGRRRQLPDAKKKGPGTGKARGHAMRAAINTPVQGSAADVATAAMISISRDARLKELGWKLLLQVHDEVILEGPKESSIEAQQLVLKNMEQPFDGTNPLLVDLAVDSKIADTWYEAK